MVIVIRVTVYNIYIYISELLGIGAANGVMRFRPNAIVTIPRIWDANGLVGWLLWRHNIALDRLNLNMFYPTDQIRFRILR
jgi:hypothetical protein